MERKFYFISIIHVILLGGLSIAPYAQNNYWTQQYSSYTALMGGTGMSNSDDNSVFYYNPGAIGFIDTMSINVSANVYAYDRVTLKNGAGDGLDLISNKLNAHAQVLAGNLYFKKAPRFKFIYGYLLRNFNRLDFEQDIEKNGNFIPAAPGSEFFRGIFDFSFSNSEYWGGVGFGYKINDHISIGLGHYGAYSNTKNLNYQDLSVDATNPDGVPYVASIRQRFKYNLNHFNILFKPGIDFRWKKHKLGLASMLPSIRIYGEGRVYRSVETGNLHYYLVDSSALFSSSPNLVVIGDQRRVRTAMKQPASISAGYEYTAKNWKVSCMVEYFFPMKEYDLIYSDQPVYARPEDAYAQQPIVDFLRVKTGSFGVLNFGIGFDKKIGRKMSLLTGFRTDFNNKVPLFRKKYEDYITSVNPQFWHFLHYSIGISIQNQNRRTYIGLLYKYGFSNYNKNFANMGNPSSDNLFLGTNNNNMNVNIHGIGFTIGYSIYSRVDKIFKPFPSTKKKKGKTRVTVPI